MILLGIVIKLGLSHWLKVCILMVSSYIGQVIHYCSTLVYIWLLIFSIVTFKNNNYSLFGFAILFFFWIWSKEINWSTSTMNTEEVAEEFANIRRALGKPVITELILRNAAFVSFIKTWHCYSIKFCIFS